MNSATLESIEANIYALPLNEQLLLMEHLAARIREKAVRSLAVREEQLAAMAADPDIQREIRQIEVEFAGTENDGLNASVSVWNKERKYDRSTYWHPDGATGER